MDMTKILARIAGHWSKVPDEKARELSAWLDRRGVSEDDMLAALDELVDDGLEFMPKTSQIAKKLKTMGAMKVTELGVGDRGVIGRMKLDIVEGIQDILELRHESFRERLAAEYDQAQRYADEDRDLELGSADYWHDRLIAFKELTAEQWEATVDA